MAAYAALVSLEHIINNLHLHPRPPISLYKEQLHHLTCKITLLQEFLQLYNPTLDYNKDSDPLEARIARAAYAAEDAIESHIFDRFTKNNNGDKISSDGLYEALEKVIRDMALIEKDAIEFKNHLHTKSTTPADSSRSSSSSPIVQIKSRMVGVDDLLLEMKSKLTGSARDLQTIPIVGMGGSGKTTLALNIFQDRFVEEHFDIRVWVTISQEYSAREILVQFLTQLIKEFDQELSEGELEEMLYKHFYGRKYMIILDDMWSLEAWDRVKRFLPDNRNGSRIVVTTRLTTLASALPNSNSLGMKLLDDDNSWDLLSKTMFGEKGFCPLELEEIGKKIGKSCKGLPLSIVVIGGLLAKSEQSIESWENMEENLNEIVNLDDDERCLKTLYMSYKQLPVHLKPCFLHMGIYRVDHVIRISKLVKLWVAEGFLKPVNGKRIEDAARMYIKDLVDRNLVMIHKVGSIGSVKECKVHDLLRDLCLREARKEGFYTIYPGHKIGNRVNRIVMSDTVPEIDALTSFVPLARSSILGFGHQEQEQPTLNFKLLRIVGSNFAHSEVLDNMHQLVNSRFLNFTTRDIELPSSICLFWNLHTLIVTQNDFKVITAPTDIWHLFRIRHLYFRNMYLPDPSPNVQDDFALAHLQTLGKIEDFTCSEQVVKRIPNIRKLLIFYHQSVDDRFCLSDLDCLDKLESLNCYFEQLNCVINFPRSLEKLTLTFGRHQHWEDMPDKIGALPLLQKLYLRRGAFEEGEWRTAEGQFPSLKFLSLNSCKGLKVWTSEASHFPRLEQLHLFNLDDLEKIPLDFAEISTLRLIDIDRCCVSAVESGKRILEEQEALYGEDETTLRVHVRLLRRHNSALVDFVYFALKNCRFRLL